ncbi:hypothetical protein CPA40_02700 [Bifidobacterium callitrichos]|uniref:Uncharacterized protein n=1 Tax=Bifidobacterium callitrichos TaxID=762209 RepID=A0A2T3GBX1_9BIFI|nr:hypothetical protein [Bifidobacterium callitrichos]PST46891.1 hypothetical protein CPA40_02700 [Bifidobacterium callitrichos]
MTFTKEQITYLESLPAVEHATATRITYTDAFKTQCLERYIQGDSPTGLFREAGLDPKIVGYKRIERSFARWRDLHDVPAYPRTPGLDGRGLDGRGGMRPIRTDANTNTDTIDATDAMNAMDILDATQYTPTNASEATAPDPRDLLIARQLHRIDELERELAELLHVRAA